MAEPKKFTITITREFQTRKFEKIQFTVQEFFEVDDEESYERQRKRAMKELSQFVMSEQERQETLYKAMDKGRKTD